MLRKTFTMLRKIVFNVANRRPCNIQRQMFASMLRVCLWYVAGKMRPTFSVSDKKGTGSHTGALFLPPGRGSQRVLGQGAWGMAHILHGIECPHRMEPSPTAQEPLLDALFEGSLRIRW
jgi:hypothetical protein